MNINLLHPPGCVVARQHRNAANAWFCENRATPLVQTCLNCRAQVSSAAKFCLQCGHPLKAAKDDPQSASFKNYTPQRIADKILTSRATLEGERKLSTVLFADLKGSMEILADRDPEDTWKFLHAVLDRMIEAVHYYEGTVPSIMGDGIMALFGAPLAHEDHAVRACYAALRMQETVAKYADEVQRSQGVPITIRVGINSGEIVISAIGNDLQMEYTVVGQTVHLAARMEQMAKPGSVLATADTFRLAEGYVSMKSLGPVQVKGLADPIQIYEITGHGAAKTRLQAAAARGLTRFVGRTGELEELYRAQQLASTRRGQVVAIVGHAGVGKSRLVQEFVHSRQMKKWLVLESNSTSYGHATPYLPVIELLRGYFKINLHDDTQLIRESVSSKILAVDPSLQDIILPVLDLFNALANDHPFRSLDAIQRRERTYQAVIRLLLTESQIQPVVAIFEDVPWYDSLSIGLLDELIVRAQQARLLLVVSSRPDYRDHWSSRPNYRQLRVDPLTGENLAKLLLALLGRDPSLETVKSFLAERARGNPFFAEELVRSLVEGGVLEGARGDYRAVRPFSNNDIPPTVQAVLAERIDRLSVSQKRLLQEAAVIGHDVPFTLLYAISGLSETDVRALLGDLQVAEFLYTTHLFPDLQYTFTHSLTHNVAYNGVLHQRRRDIHARVVDALEKQYADRLDDQAEQLAHHAVRGELKEKAARYLRQAGVKASMRSALADSRSRFEQALAILKTLPEDRAALEDAFEIRLELRPVLRQLGEGRHMLEHLRETETIAERLKDDRRRGLICAFMTTVQSTLDELDEAVLSASRALEIAERSGDLRLRIVAGSFLEQAHCYRGEYEHVVALAHKNLAALPPELVHEFMGMAVPPSIFDRAWLVISLSELGRFAEAEKYEIETIQIAKPMEHAFATGWAHFAASMPHLLRGDWVKASRLVEYWIITLRSGNVGIHLPWAVASYALTLAQLGETSEAKSRIEEAEQLLEHQAARGIVGHRGWAYHAVGRAHLLLGQIDEARRLGERAVETSQRQPGFAAHAQHLLGDIAIHPDRFDAERGRVYYEKALTSAERRGMRPLAAHCHLGLGKLYRRSGNLALARENLAVATSMYHDMTMGFWLKQANIALNEIGS